MCTTTALLPRVRRLLPALRRWRCVVLFTRKSSSGTFEDTRGLERCRQAEDWRSLFTHRPGRQAFHKRGLEREVHTGEFFETARIQDSERVKQDQSLAGQFPFHRREQYKLRDHLRGENRARRKTKTQLTLFHRCTLASPTARTSAPTSSTRWRA